MGSCNSEICFIKFPTGINISMYLNKIMFKNSARNQILSQPRVLPKGIQVPNENVAQLTPQLLHLREPHKAPPELLIYPTVK